MSGRCVNPKDADHNLQLPATSQMHKSILSSDINIFQEGSDKKIHLHPKMYFGENVSRINAHNNLKLEGCWSLIQRQNYTLDNSPAHCVQSHLGTI